MSRSGGLEGGSKAVVDDSFEDRSDFGGVGGGATAVFDDSFEDRSDSGGSTGGSKAVVDDSFGDRNDFGGSREVRRQLLTTVSRIIAILAVSTGRRFQGS